MKDHKDLFQALLAGETLINKSKQCMRLENGQVSIYCENWKSPHHNPVRTFIPEHWQIKPKTILIGDIEVPEPLRVAPENKETIIYIVDFNKYSLYEACSWNAYATGDLVDGPLKHGLIHLTPENAILHAKALLSFTERKSND